jgi:eukaryotic-like serine/threonine-protein kinase
VVAGRYTLVRLLGRGGMGAVWQARDTLLDRDVAIKEIYLPAAGGGGPATATDPLTLRALREAKAAAQLRHPGIITVYDVVTDDDRPWIVMELIGGRSMAEAILDQGVLPVWQAAEIGLRVLEALRAAHRRGILHRDVKPANILLDEDRVVLTDFGIAAIDGATILTGTGQMLGSPSYLSPERVNGQAATAAADLWGLGVTLYAAVTGRSPFQREDTQATLAAVLTSQPEPPAHAGQLWPVIKGFLVKDPGQRLTVDQAAPLLASAAQRPDTPRPSRRRRKRRFTSDAIAETAIAPSPTLAAPTGPQPLLGAAPPAPATPQAIAAPAPATRETTTPTVPTARETTGPTARETTGPTARETTGPTARETTTAPVAAPAGQAPATVELGDPGTDSTTAGLPDPPSMAVRTEAGGGSGPAPIQSPRRPFINVRRVVGAGAVAGLVLLTITMTRLVSRHDEETGSLPAASHPAAAVASLSASPSPSYPPGIDPCLLGTWRVTSNQVWGLIDGTRVLYSGGAGILVTYRKDGTTSGDYSKMKPRTTRYRGATWADVIRGSTSGTYYAEDGTITGSNTKSTAVGTVRRNGKFNASAPVTFFPEPDQYRCKGNNLQTYSAQGNYSDDMVRVSGSSS